MNTILCADIGTSSLKAALIAGDGSVAAKSRRPLLLCNTTHASKEWLPALQVAAKELSERAPQSKVDSLCISGNGPTLVNPRGDTLLWNEKVSELPCDSIFIPRLLAFKDSLGADWDSSERIFSGPEYLIFLLTESAHTILPSENFKRAYWSRDELLRCGLSAADANKLPPFIQSGKLAGHLSHKAASFLQAEEIGVVDGTPVFAGAPDFVSALLGTATVEQGLLCDRAGSSEGVNFSSEVPIEGEGIRTLPSAIDGLWNAAVLLPETGFRFSAFKQKVERELARDISFGELVESLIASDGSNPTMDQGKYLMIQTALEVRDAVSALREAARARGLPFPKKMTVTGGQAQNDGWNQMKADITGMKIQVPALSDAELLGDAIFAFTEMKMFPDLKTAAKSLCKIQKTFAPRK